MNLQAFAYPQRHIRQHAPAGYANYGEYKPWLRDEFVFRCVYCLSREQWCPDRHRSFSVDHVYPQVDYPELECDYDNLVYACNRCNSYKGDVLVLDPTQKALSGHLSVDVDGSISASTVEGKDLVALLHLNSTEMIETRRTYLEIAALKAKLPTHPGVDRVFRSAFRYPDDLPDLRSKRPPNGNIAEPKTKSCHFARKEAHSLPDFY